VRSRIACLDLIGNSAVTIRDYDTIVHERKLVLELAQGGFLTNCPPRWLALYSYLQRMGARTKDRGANAWPNSNGLLQRMGASANVRPISNRPLQRIGARTNAQLNSHGLLQSIGASMNAWPYSDRLLQRMGARVTAWLNSNGSLQRIGHMHMRGHTVTDCCEGWSKHKCAAKQRACPCATNGHSARK
jgi:hypothetical protein